VDTSFIRQQGCHQTVHQPRADTLVSGGTLGGSLGPNRRGAYGRGPLERGIRTLPARGIWRGRGRGHGHRASLPARRTGETNTLPGWIKGNFPRTDPRLDASPRWPNRSPSSVASCKSAPRRASCSDACPSLRGESSFETFTRACAATTRRRAPSWATHSDRASIGPLRLLMPARSCVPAKGANFTPTRPTSLRTPSRQSPSRGPSPCGGWTSSGPCRKRPGATPTYWLPLTSSPSGSSAPDHESQGRAGRDVLHRHHLRVRGA
jgi:hypothetical protein